MYSWVPDWKHVHDNSDNFVGILYPGLHHDWLVCSSLVGNRQTATWTGAFTSWQKSQQQKIRFKVRKTIFTFQTLLLEVSLCKLRFFAWQFCNMKETSVSCLFVQYPISSSSRARSLAKKRSCYCCGPTQFQLFAVCLRSSGLELREKRRQLNIDILLVFPCAKTNKSITRSAWRCIRTLETPI